MAIQKEKEGTLYSMLPSSDKIINQLLPSCSRMIKLINDDQMMDWLVADFGRIVGTRINYQ